ncbi:MAG: prevent-host-death family protein [bacterium]|nr:MAG: prevent-host-death family protein [bacterium]
MSIVNIHEAKTHFSKLLEKVLAGEEIIIGKSGKPIAKLVPYKQSDEPRQPGMWKGQVWMADDFDELPEEIMAAFRGESE